MLSAVRSHENIIVKNSQGNLNERILVSLGAELSIGRAYPKTGGLRGDEFRPPGKVRLFTKQLS